MIGKFRMLFDCRGTVRESIYRFFTEVSFSDKLFLFRAIYSLFIFLSVACNVLATVPEQSLYNTHSTLRRIDQIAYYIFASELLVILATSPSFKAFFLSPYTYLDLLGIVPYFVSLGVDSLNDYRTLEFLIYLVPSTRLLKVTRTSAGWTVLVLTVKRAFKPMLVPMLFLLFLLVFFSCALYFVEAEFIGEYATNITTTTTTALAASATEPTTDTTTDTTTFTTTRLQKPIKSWFIMRSEGSLEAVDVSVNPTFKTIPEALYFAAIVATTVGLGDFSCKTRLGRMLSAVLALAGVLYVALPISTFGSTFVEVWKDRERLLIIEKIKKRVRSYRTIQIAELQELFNFCDKDGSGVIDVEEFTYIVNSEFKLDLPEYLVVRVFRTMGGSDSGTVDFRQFCQFFFPHVVLKADLIKARMPFKRAQSAGVSDSVSVGQPVNRQTTRRLNTIREKDLEAPSPGKVLELANSQEALSFLLQTVHRLERDLRTVAGTCRALQQSLATE